MPTKNLGRNAADELRPEYDLSSLTGRVRGKYHARAAAGTIMVLLEPDVAEAFSDGASVNMALRSYLRASHGKPSITPRGAKKAKSRSRTGGL